MAEAGLGCRGRGAGACAGGFSAGGRRGALAWWASRRESSHPGCPGPYRMTKYCRDLTAYLASLCSGRCWASCCGRVPPGELPPRPPRLVGDVPLGLVLGEPLRSPRRGRFPGSRRQSRCHRGSRDCHCSALKSKETSRATSLLGSCSACCSGALGRWPTPEAPPAPGELLPGLALGELLPGLPAPGEVSPGLPVLPLLGTEVEGDEPGESLPGSCSACRFPGSPLPACCFPGSPRPARCHQGYPCSHCSALRSKETSRVMSRSRAPELPGTELVVVELGNRPSRRA